MSPLYRYYHIRIVAAEPETVLTKLLMADIELMDIERVDFLTVEIVLQKAQLSAAKCIFDKAGVNYSILGKDGILWYLAAIKKRILLLAGILIYIALALTFPRRIFFVKVTGNEQITAKQILQQAENCGITFGAKAAEVRSENVKNLLLGELPQLQWLGVTTSGCVATIQVKERVAQTDRQETSGSVSSITAARDGIITEMNVYKGSPLVQVGQTVKAGDILISGYTDCGIKTTAQNADGEVFAYTLRNLSVISPVPTVIRGENTREHTCYRLRVGKKVINLCNHSGIPDTTCVKMYLEDYWTLPGGFQLPVSVIRVTCIFFETDAALYAQNENDWLARYASDYVRAQMVAGQVLDESLIWNMCDGVYELTGNYACHEMIGQVKHEETIEQYAEDN